MTDLHRDLFHTHRIHGNFGEYTKSNPPALLMMQYRQCDSCRYNRRGCRKYKSFDPTFSKVGGFLGQRPESSSAELETPKTSEKVPLFGTF
ncbi:MAG: hypothetical protein IKI93_08175, partial [Clostridia bacterium]|nr:hypothetical protein [Clostridia bacterium]